MAQSIPTHPTIPETGFLRLPDVLQLIPISRSGWYRGIAEGRYPKGCRLSKNTAAWRAEDISELISKLGEQGGEYGA